MKEYGIDKVPLLIACNSLHKFPDFFTIGQDSFFVVDKYLYDYFYDFNYLISRNTLDEYFVNLIIKNCAESLYIAGEIDVCYWLCATSPTVETDFKDSTFFSHDIMVPIVEITDLQEAFILLHEASHFIYSSSKDIEDDSQYQEVVFQFNCFIALYEQRRFPQYLENVKQIDDLLQECFCDSRSAIYLLNKSIEKGVANEQIMDAVFNAVIYSYILELCETTYALEESDIEDYFDIKLWCWQYRINNLYYTLSRYVDNLGLSDALSVTYDNAIGRYNKYSEYVRDCVASLKRIMRRNSSDMDKIVKLDFDEKESFIRDYLHLL